MFKFEISVWTTMFWVRAYVISDKSSMRWLLYDNCDEMSKYEVFVQRGMNMCHIFHWVIFILITPGLCCNSNDIR